MQSSAVFHRSFRDRYKTATKGKGIYLFDSDGKKYIDACGGAAVVVLGYDNQSIINAVQRQMAKLSYVHSTFFTTDVMEEFSQHLIDHAPANYQKVYLVSGGSEAIESALKLARQYYIELGQPNRKYVIARRQSYHGNTLGALSVGGNYWRREPFDPLLMPGHHVSPAYAYRDQLPSESEEDYAFRLANELEATIQSLDPEHVMAFIAEPVVGATAGALTAPASYFRRVREICDRYGVLLILDEVMCGMGRTGTLHACEQEGVQADIQTSAKAIASGYQALGVVFANKLVVDVIRKGSGMFQHGHTYIGHALACAAGLATQKEIQDKNILDHVRTQGDYMKKMFQEHLGDHPYVGDIRGRGFFLGLELVAHRQSKEPFDPALKIDQQIKKAGLEEGVMCYPMGGTIDGKRGNHILVAPQYITTKDEITEIVDLIAKVTDKVTKANG